MKGCSEHLKASTSAGPVPIAKWKEMADKTGATSDPNFVPALNYATLEFLFPSFGYCGHALNKGLLN
jgi:hypothetical protein